MSNLTSDNHTVPQGYLRGWSTDGANVWAYRLLVPTEKYPEWDHRPIRSLACYQHLYTSVASGHDSDEFERWLNRHIETPAADALAKVRTDRPLSTEDWHRLAFYAAALDVRTPVSYVEQMERFSKTIPEILERTVKNLPAKIRKAKKQQTNQASQGGMNAEAIGRFPIRVSLEQQPDGKKALKVEVTADREMWLWNMRHLLTNTAKIFTKHSWTILRPWPGSLWFTSDHPLIRLNYYAEANYDFRGGWGKPGSEIILPLSPTHLMYAKVGTKSVPTETLSAEQTLAFQRLIAERAHRWIVAKDQPQRAVWFRARRVSLMDFRAEEEAQQSWHEIQRNSALNTQAQSGDAEERGAA